MQEERRKTARIRSLLGSRIQYPDNARTVDAMTRNVSDGGALIEVDFTVILPETFGFMVRSGAPVRPARLAWRRGNKAGVVYAA